MAWTLKSALDRLTSELDSVMQFWLKHSHDKQFGYGKYHRSEVT